MFDKSFANVWIWTSDLWCRRRPLYQLSSNHCPPILTWLYFFSFFLCLLFLFLLLSLQPTWSFLKFDVPPTLNYSNMIDRSVLFLTSTKEESIKLSSKFLSYFIGRFRRQKDLRKPWSSVYARRLMFKRSWVWISAPDTGWTFLKTENKWKESGNGQKLFKTRS